MKPSPITCVSVAVHLASVLVLSLSTLSAQAQSTNLSAVQKGRCPTGYQLLTNGSANPPYAYCRQTVTTSVRQYTSYQPCPGPGTYQAQYESTGGLLPAGHDRCTGLGGVVTGPGVPCLAPYALREIRSGQFDRCYRMVNEQTQRYINLNLFQ